MIDACFNYVRFADRDCRICSECLTVFLFAHIDCQWPDCFHSFIVETLVIRDHFSYDGCIDRDDVPVDISRGSTSEAFIGVINICQIIGVNFLGVHDTTCLDDRLTCVKIFFGCLVLCPCYLALAVRCRNWKL